MSENKYLSVPALIEALGFSGDEQKQKAVVALLMDPEFANGRAPVTRNNTVYVPYQTVYDAAHNGPAGVPADQMYDKFPELPFEDLPEAAPEQEARAPRAPRTPAADPTPQPSTDTAEGRVAAALGGLPEGSVAAPPAPAPSTPERTPDAPPADEKPKRTRRTKAQIEADEAAAAAAAAKTDEPEVVTAANAPLPTSAVDAAVARVEAHAAGVSQEEVISFLTKRREELRLELAAVLYALENL